MTSLTEQISINEINHNSNEYELDSEQTTFDNNQDNVEETTKINGFNSTDALNNHSPTLVNSDNQQEKEVKESSIVHHDHDENHENRPRKLFNSKTKYSSMPYQRSAFYLNEHYYDSVPYFYYQQQTLSAGIEKPTPLMFISTQSSSSSLSPPHDNSISVSPLNLPPRLRQTSTNENDSNSQTTATTTSQTTTSSTTTPSTQTNGRRHRSILPRINNSFLPHPPPLMATPPGVLYPYPPAVHPPGHIAYNIRSPEELEMLALQQQMFNYPPGTMLWPAQGHPAFSPYSIPGMVPPPPPPPSAFFENHSSLPQQQANSFLNPDAAEWVPPSTGNCSPSNDQILIDDEINFPPLNSTTTTNNNNHINNKDLSEENLEQEHIDNHSSELNSTNHEDKSTISIDNSNNQLPNISTSSSQDDNPIKPLSSSPVKITPLNYSTIISQTSESNKLNKTNSTNSTQQTRTITKQQTPQKPQVNSRRRQPMTTNRMQTRNLLTSDLSSSLKQQSSELTDDWIEVKSKKTKKFDRNINETSVEKLPSDEQIVKSSSPLLSQTSTSENTSPATFTSEDDLDEKDNHQMANKTNTSTDFNRNLIDNIHRKLDNHERLLILMRGCPGSGKSTLAKSLNTGYNGVILSADDYFTDTILNTYAFDATRLDEAHRHVRQRTLDAFKRNVSPVIIDNTNTQAWEMKPYVAMGKEADYEILLVEPQTPWRYKARELFKRNTHNLPIRRIKDMLTRFEHNLTIENLLNEISPRKKSDTFSSSNQPNHCSSNQDTPDSNLISKKSYDTIDDSAIANDVRLCINDMILFLTSNFYQTTRSTSSPTSLSVSFHDLSLISTTPTSIPTTPTTPHARFPRTFTRFPSTNQEHSLTADQLLRLPSSAFTRPIEINSLTPPLSVQSSFIEKKRKKNKNKQQTNDFLLNVNNNNNNEQVSIIERYSQQIFNVILPEEDCSEFLVIDEQDTNQSNDSICQNHEFCNYSSPVSHSPKQTSSPKPSNLLNILHNELLKPSVSIKHQSIQCSFDDLQNSLNENDIILIGHPPTKEISQRILPIRSGFNECGIQVDFNENNLELLINIYSSRVSNELIEQFYEICHFDYSWTCEQIDEHLRNHSQQQTIPTLRQLTLNKLNQWNEEIKSINPSFNTNSMNDLLEDINNDETFESLNANQITLPWSIFDSLEDTYGELPNKSSLMSNNHGLVLTCDDELMRNMYQALQRCLVHKPVIKKENSRKQPTKNLVDNQKWKSTTKNEQSSSSIPSFRQIMDEEQHAMKCQKSKQKQQLDYASEHKFKELERHFPLIDGELLLDIFRENEYDYDITYVCLSTMFDEHVSIPIRPKFSSPSTPSIERNPVEPIVESYEDLRCDALRHAQKRKEFYAKAQQANRHGMSGVASFYIHRACEETQLMKDANRSAYERLSQWRLKQFSQTQQLDLHGLHSDEALHLFKQIEQEFNVKTRRTTLKSMEIITGYGKNSVYGGSHGKIRSMIVTYLQQRNYKYSEPNRGVILLQL